MNNAAIPSIFDSQSLSALKGGLRKDDPQSLKAAARQFEAVFLQMVLKSMRAATPQDSMLDSEQTKFYQELLDSQMAQVMSAKGGTGLAAVLERQFARAAKPQVPEGVPAGLPLAPEQPAYPFLPGMPKPLSSPLERAYPLLSVPAPVPSAPTFPAQPGGDGSSESFSNAIWPYAVSASRQTGIPPEFMVAQAALETGWGRYEPRLADGRQSFNLFGIKAGSNWSGPVAESSTTEYLNGGPVRRTERFRAYASYAEAFDDYARLLTTQPRYAQVLGTRDAASFARGLQSAGYATDPAYADKVTRVISGITNGSRTRS